MQAVSLSKHTISKELKAGPGERRSIRRNTCSVQKVSCFSVRPEYVPGKISNPNYVRVFDTTLRDGEQSAGVSLSASQKLQIAQQLFKLGVDIIEAGFPIASKEDFDAIQNVAREVGNYVDATGYSPVICAFSRTKRQDVETAWNAVRLARRPRVQTFIATSNIHMEYKLKMTPDQVVDNAVTAVKMLRDMGCEDIQFCSEDATRSDLEFMYRILGEVIEAGATTLNLCDTTGWSMPHEYGRMMEKLIKNTPGSDKVIWSAHCHNDLGLATANDLAGALGGARQVECCVNGIGERAGNSSLEEVVMAIKLRGDTELEGLHTGVNTEFIAPVSKLVSDHTGMLVQPHKAIVGANAFAHQSGIHQDGMLKSRKTYEIMSPETIGLKRAHDGGIVLGKLSGRRAVRTRLQQLGYQFDNDQFQQLFDQYKALTEKKKIIMDEDLLTLVAKQQQKPEASKGMIWELEELEVSCGTVGEPSASVKLRGQDNILRSANSTGNGPIDAAYRAIDQICGSEVKLLDYAVSSITQGIKAIVITQVVIKPLSELVNHSDLIKPQNAKDVEGSFTGSGADQDIIVSSARAYMNALNKMVQSSSSIEQAVEQGEGVEMKVQQRQTA
eukprot:TRINITY_DN746_c0_g2_i1.p1 TRINITY_DN746_c0_g2~~TRINITY_DN746_c0_g2_i1.p1  ORF type:complete len:613 (-),score=80.03 TRINITY_DN746_c0_g2_i1:2058-3896(-)